MGMEQYAEQRKTELFHQCHEELIAIEMAIATAIRLGKTPQDVLRISNEPHYSPDVGGGNTPIRNITLVARDLLDQMVVCSESSSRKHGLGFRFDRVLSIIEKHA